MALPKFTQKKVRLPQGTLVLREVKPRDLKALNAIFNEPEVNRLIYLPSPISVLSTKRHAQELKRIGAKWVAAELDGKVIGSVELRPRKHRQSHVAGFGIAFSSKAQGSGAAAQALQAVFAYAKKSGIEIIFAGCFEDNARARGFYRKLGFREVAIMDGHIKRGLKRLGEVLIEKRL